MPSRADELSSDIKDESTVDRSESRPGNAIVALQPLVEEDDSFVVRSAAAIAAISQAGVGHLQPNIYLQGGREPLLLEIDPPSQLCCIKVSILQCVSRD